LKDLVDQVEEKRCELRSEELRRHEIQELIESDERKREQMAIEMKEMMNQICLLTTELRDDKSEIRSSTNILRLAVKKDGKLCSVKKSSDIDCDGTRTLQQFPRKNAPEHQHPTSHDSNASFHDNDVLGYRNDDLEENMIAIEGKVRDIDLNEEDSFISTMKQIKIKSIKSDHGSPLKQRSPCHSPSTATVTENGTCTASSQSCQAKREFTSNQPKASSQEDIKNKAIEILQVAKTISGVDTAESSVSTATSVPSETNQRIDMNYVTQFGKCTCEDEMFEGQADLVEFYLPKLGICCKCGNGPKSSPIIDGTALVCILRPWQVAFLASIEIFDSIDFIHAFKERSGTISKQMRRWRRANSMLAVKTKSCMIALHIWYRTATSVLRSMREQHARGIERPEIPDFLRISIAHADSNSVSTMGFGSFR
jgi:hypothetical protein